MRKTRDNNKKQIQNKKNSNGHVPNRTTNDPIWYASNPDLLRDAASYPFAQALGTNVDRGNRVNDFNIPNDAIPGICRIDLRPSLGLSVTKDSALNTAATAMYTFVRCANSGHPNYDSPDLMLYCSAMAQVYAFINWCQRLYGIATLYAQKNRYIPRNLMLSMDVNPESIVNNLASFRYWINVMIAKASSLAVPATMSYFSRTAFLYSNIYSESQSIKDQLYYFHPAAWLKFEFNSGSDSGSLKSVSLKATGESGLTLAEIQQFGDELLGTILADEDMNIMSGDILKAYGPNGIIKLSSLPEMYTLIPVHDEYVLEQIHNATVLEVPAFDIVQSSDKSYLESIPFLPWSDDDVNAKARVALLCLNKVLSTSVADAGPTEVVEGTRLMLAGDVSRSTEAGYYVHSGTEIAVDCRLYFFNAGSELMFHRMESATYADGYKAAGLHAFKYAPSIMMYDPSDLGKKCFFVESIDNYTVLNYTDIDKLHDVCLMNMLAVPSIAKV